MTRTSFALSSRRFAPLTLLVVLAASIVGPAFASAAETVSLATLTAQEAKVVNLLNADRAAVGLVPVRVDSRLMAIARARSADMIAKHYFSHTLPDGRNVFDIRTASNLRWFGAGEIIAWNNYPTLETSVPAANNQWLNSPGHKAIVVSTTYNYVGVGLALGSNGKKIWTAVYLRGPDRTGARATTAKPTIADGATGASKRVTVSWSGADVKLQVLTSGFHSFQVQRRVDGGPWTMVWVGTTVKSMTLDLAASHTYEFRVAARDTAGNWGAWSVAKATLPAATGAVVVTR